MCICTFSDVRKFKDTKKHFDKVREDLEIAQVKNAQAPRNKPHEVEEATSTLNFTRKCFRHLALDYVLQVTYKRINTHVYTVYEHTRVFYIILFSITYRSTSFKPKRNLRS